MRTKENFDLPKRPRRNAIDAAGKNKLVTTNLDQANYVYRWVNDTDARILDLKERGYEFVDKDGKIVGDMSIDSAKSESSIISQRMGGGITGYLMAIPKEFYEEDQKLKQEKVDELERAMFANAKDASNYGKLDVNIRR